MKRLRVIGHLGRVGSKTMGILSRAVPGTCGYDVAEGVDIPPELDDWVVLCLPVESLNGEFNYAPLIQAMRDHPARVGYVVRTTVHPEFFDLSEVPKNVIHWPEFYAWTGNSAEDYPEVLGYADQSLRDEWLSLTAMAFPSAQKFVFTDLKTSALGKLSINTYLALKVQFARDVAKTAGEVGADYQVIRQILGEDSRIGYSHLQVLGYPARSHCLSKDVPVLLKEFTGG